jgi:striatin 1/3/4
MNLIFKIFKDKLIKNLIGHTDAVSCLSFNKNKNYIASVSHDGSMRTWDIRKF